MGAMIAELQANGLVTRNADPNDRRRQLLSLTKAGGRALADGRAARRTWLAQSIDDKLDTGEQKSLLIALALVRRIAEP